MQRHRRPGVRSVAVLSGLGLALGVAAAIPTSNALADSPNSVLAQALADPTSPASDALDPGIVAELPKDMTFRLSPELAAALGTSTLNMDQAKALLAKRGASTPALPGAQTPAVGTKRMWPALDMTPNTSTAIPPFGLYLKEYTLQAKKPNIEIWVASGTDSLSTGTQFPAGDCRVTKKDPTVVTQADAEGLANEFQNKMLPVESKFYSVAPAADGSLGIGQLAPLGVDFTGNGDSTVTLVDNVRDPNFYDFVNNRTYIAGFFAPIFNQITNRNVMTIDAFDWIHRTGDNPKNEPSEDICQSRPARPRTYESVFAHEYQHLLHSYTNPNPSPVGTPFRSEDLWINEGLSDMAPFLVGYSNATRNVHQTKAESHLFCFQGYGEVKGPANPNPNYCGGPENSLTLWEDQGGNSDILADYGNAWSFMIFLYDRYGAGFISALHRDPAFGLESLQGLLDKSGGGAKAVDVIHDYQLMNLLDNRVSAKGAKLVGADRAAVSSKELKAAINYTYKGAYEAAGAAPNGADYVVLRGADGKILSGKALRSLEFAGVAADGGNKVENWIVRLVGIDDQGKRYLVRSFDNAFDLKLSAGDLKQFASYKRVVAVISVDDLAEAHQTYVPYSFTVNGAKQLGG
jgi:hypothetical protein